MTHEQLEKLKQDPIKYQQYKEKQREYKKKYIQKLKQDPVKREKYLQYKRNYQNSWVKKHKQLNDVHYLNYINNIKQYQKTNKQKTNEANKKYRQKIGPEYMKNYMRQYRAENRNNINEKEKIYHRKRNTLLSQQLKEKKKHCEQCNTNITNITLNGLCYECFIKEELKGNIFCKYPKVYWFDDIDIVVTKWSLLKTIKWYNEYYGSNITKKDVKEITDIEKEGYWDTHITDSESLLLSYLYDTKFCYIKQYNNKDTFGDLQCVYGDFYKYISFKEGLLKYYMNIKEPEIMCSTEF